jgi:prepilin-type N-terminal cleavage/methylation domain-containing protein
MKYYDRQFSQKGFTVPEVLVAISTFLILALLIGNSLLLGIKYVKQAEKKISDQIVCRGAIEIIVNDLRQGVPNLDPGNQNPPTGYQGIEPPVSTTTAVLMPNENDSTSKYIEFTKPNYEVIDASETGFDRMKPEMFRIIKYYCQDMVLYREMRTINQDGSINPPVIIPIAEVENGVFELTVEYINQRLFKINFSINKMENDKIITTSSYTVIAAIVVE